MQNPQIKKILETPIDEWTTMNMVAMLCEIYTNVNRLEAKMDKKANKWVERVVGIFMLGTTSWALYQVASLIEVARAFF